MSYILEALRKSERERQLAKAPPLPLLLAEPPPQRRNRLPWLLLALLLGFNGAAWWYFGYGDRRTSPPISPIAGTERAPQPVADTSSVKKIPGSNVALSEAETSGHNSAMQQKTAAESGAFPAAAAGNQPLHNEPLKNTSSKANLSVPKNAAVENEAPAKQPPPSAVQLGTSEEQSGKGGAPLGIGRFTGPENKHLNEKHTAVVQSAHPVANREPPGAEPESIPLLSAMPEDFRQRTPPLIINVLAYSSKPEERFAIIKMVKYTIGDSIPGGAVLLEIRSDSLVLDLDGTKFRIAQR
jgi:general secretion pathway protein B